MQTNKANNLSDQTVLWLNRYSAMSVVCGAIAEGSRSDSASLQKRSNNRKSLARRGTTLVEFALVLPLFFLFVFAPLEFGHALMVMNMLTAISKEAALLGSFDGTTTADVQQLVNDRLSSTLDGVTASVSVKDASTFELSTSNPATVDIATLPTIELNKTESRQLFIVHLEVPYDNVALLPTMWIRGVTLRGDSVMRRE